MAGTHRHGQDLKALIAEVESSREALAGANRPPGQARQIPRTLWEHPAVTATALLLVAGGVVWALRSRARKSAKSRKAHHSRNNVLHGWKSPDLSRLTPSWLQQAIQPAPPPRATQNVALARVIVAGLVELLKPAVTQMLTKKAAGSIGTALMSGLFKAVVASRNTD